MHTHDYHMNAGGQRTVSDPVVLELWVVVNYLAWVLETENLGPLEKRPSLQV